MTRARIRHRWPRLRWYLQLLRLNAARLLDFTGRERWARASALFFALSATFLAIYEQFRPPPVPTGEHAPVLAAISLVWQIGLLILSALITAALTPKPKPPEKVKASVPVVDDGKGIERLYGACWFDDGIFLGFKQMGTKKIYAKGGKKG